MGDTKPNKKVIVNDKTPRADENSKLEAFSSHEIQIPQQFVSKPPRSFKIPQTNRNFAATSK